MGWQCGIEEGVRSWQRDQGVRSPVVGSIVQKEEW